MAQNKNGPIIGLAIFSVLSVMFAIFWYLAYSDNTANAQALVNASNKEQELTGKIAEQIADSNTLKDKIGVGHSLEVGSDGEEGSVAGTVDAILRELGGDGTAAPPNLIESVRSLNSESSKNGWSADNRLEMNQKQANDHQQALAVKDAEIAQFKAAAENAEKELVAKETEHSAQMKELETQLTALSKEKSELEIAFAKLEEDSRREKEDLLDEIARQRQGLVALRKRLRDKEDSSFSRPDGIVTNVDHNAQLCYIDLGSADGLRTGVTFSVYAQNHSGVGRANTSDIKGSIEVTEILGPRRSKARIVTQKSGQPVSGNDPIYSPLFSAGETLEIAVAGQIRIMGLNRDEFRRLVTASGAKIAVEVGEDGQFADGKGNPISEEEARQRITARTRYLVIGDLGDPNSTSADSNLETLYADIRKKKEVLEKEAENLGIYPIGLSSFLEHIGYTRKQLAWTPENGQPFPARLAAGSRSTTANSTFGDRQSSAVISGRYSGRKKAALVSGGTTSKAYSN